MRKATLDKESEKFGDDFFGHANPDENAALSCEHTAQLREVEKEPGLTIGNQPVGRLLKQVFIFFPGTFLLFFMSYGAGIILMETVVFGRRREELPSDYPLQFALIGSIILLGALMTWFGLGDIKNKKHFVIPASLIASGAITGAIVKAAAKMSDWADKMLDDFGYLIYLFPLALVIPILAKSLVDRNPADVSE